MALTNYLGVATKDGQFRLMPRLEIVLEFEHNRFPKCYFFGKDFFKSIEETPK